MTFAVSFYARKISRIPLDKTCSWHYWEFRTCRNHPSGEPQTRKNDESYMITIGSVPVETHIFLAPLSGCSDLAFRLIAREHGAKFCFFEMIDGHSLLGPHAKRVEILNTVAADRPIAAQLVGEKPELLRDAAQVLLEHTAVSFLDLNSACPVKKVVKKGAGAGLLQNLPQLYHILNLLATTCAVPVTVKLRIGFQRVDLAWLRELAQGCQDSGAAALFVHGRTREQGYSGDVNYEAIRVMKHAVTIPVIGSGNVFDPLSAQRMLTETDCDGVLVARGAFGNPWIFQQIEQYLATGTLLPEASRRAKKAALIRHLAYLAEYKHNSVAGKIGIMRKVTLWYVKGFPNAAKIRGQMNTIGTYPELLEFVDRHLTEEGEAPDSAAGINS